MTYEPVYYLAHIFPNPNSLSPSFRIDFHEFCQMLKRSYGPNEFASILDGDNPGYFKYLNDNSPGGRIADAIRLIVESQTIE